MSDEQQQQPQGVNIMDDAPTSPSEAQNQRAEDPSDPNVLLGNILKGLSELQIVMEMVDARISQLERLTGYLLQKDPDFMKNLQAAEAAAKAAQPAEETKAQDGPAAQA